MKFRILVFLFTIGFSSALLAQNISVNGTVTDGTDGLPLSSISVVVKNSSRGTITDFDGNFSISVAQGSTLVFSGLGYKTQEVVVNSTAALSITLLQDVAQLDQVVVIGYGTQRKKEITGAVSVISSDVIEELKPVRVEQALQGQVAGVQINSNSGSPGAASTISIRGVSTNGDSRPLILVDGNVIEDLSVINPADIASINVLKDATAGIYGVRAANGVILVTTKTGRKNTPLTVEINKYTGFQQTTREIPLLNATEYALLVNEAFAASGDNIVYPNAAGLGQGTRWQDEVFQNAAMYEHAITLRGGGEKSTYVVGTSLLTQDGIVGGQKSNFTRVTGRTSYVLDFLENFKLTSGFIYTHTSRRTLAETGLGSVLFNALNMAPTLSVRDPNGDFTIAEGLGNEVINPIAQIDNTFNRTLVDKIAGNVGLSYNFLDYFSAETNIQFNYADVRSNVFNPIAFFGSGKVFNRDRSEVVENRSYFRDYTFDAFVKYNRSFKDTHNLNLLLGTSIFQTTGSFTGFVGFDIPDNNVDNAQIAEASDVQNIFPNGNAVFDARLLSYFARLQYDYKGKYLLSAVIRRDGSTKFGPENKFGFFPSASIGWVVSDEQFLESSNTLSFLKLRASYGILGNDRIPDFRFVSLLNGEGAYVIDNEIVFGTALGAVANPEIRWEKQKAFDVGLDARFFNNQVDITFDYFNRKTEDLLVVPQVSGLLGTAAPGSAPPVVNAGTVQNKGFEFAVGYNQKISDKVKFGIRYNLTTLENEVLSVSTDGDFIAGGSFGVGQDPPARMEAGFPIGYFRGFKTDGIFQTQDEIDNYPVINDQVQPGDLRFVDLNGDGVINDDDKTQIGKPLPDVTMGLNLSANVGNFDFIAYGFASFGNDIVRNYERNQPLTNRTTYYLDRWTGAGSTDAFPRVTSGANSNNLFSDFFVEDGSFFRLQNAQIGYTFPEAITERMKIKSLRFYISANNLFTLTKYTGFDPTASTGEPIGGGIDYGFYPNPRIYQLGVNLKF